MATVGHKLTSQLEQSALAVDVVPHLALAPLVDLLDLVTQVSCPLRLFPFLALVQYFLCVYFKFI